MKTKLSYLERTRLLELKQIADGTAGRWCVSHFNSMPATNRKLVERGFAERKGARYAKSGRMLEVGTVHITDAGQAALA